MPNCVICGKETKNVKTCGAEECVRANKYSNARNRYSGLSKEQKKKERSMNIVARNSVCEKVLCKCPRCGKTHIHTFSYGWSGRTKVPYKYCDVCYSFMMYTHNDVVEVPFNIREVHGNVRRAGEHAQSPT